MNLIFIILFQETVLRRLMIWFIIIIFYFILVLKVNILYMKVGIVIQIVSTIYNIDMEVSAIVFKYAWREHSLPGKIILKYS